MMINVSDELLEWYLWLVHGTSGQPHIRVIKMEKVINRKVITNK